MNTIKNLSFLMLLLFSMQSQAYNNADFAQDVGGDKQAHFIVGAVISLSLYTFTPLTLKQSFYAGVLAGLAKEVADRKTTGFNMKDFAATAAGSGAVFIVYKWEF